MKEENEEILNGFDDTLNFLSEIDPTISENNKLLFQYSDWLFKKNNKEALKVKSEKDRWAFFQFGFSTILK